MSLIINNLNVNVGNKQILVDFNLNIQTGEIHAIMGPNGCGKSTLANTIAGNPKYDIKTGEILFENIKINNFKPDERTHKGIFLSFQTPFEVPGLKLHTLLYNMRKAKEDMNFLEFKKELNDYIKQLNMDPAFLERYLNVGLSGGEKKKVEILQLLISQPKILILDEIDSGLDVDALKSIANAIIEYKKASNATILIITHYPRILNYIIPDKVHVIKNGTIVQTGTKELANEIESNGYVDENN